MFFGRHGFREATEEAIASIDHIFGLDGEHRAHVGFSMISFTFGETFALNSAVSVAYGSDAFDGHWPDERDGWCIDGNGEVHGPGV